MEDDILFDDDSIEEMEHQVENGDLNTLSEDTFYGEEQFKESFSTMAIFDKEPSSIDVSDVVDSVSDNTDVENSMNGTCSCRSECMYNSGASYKYADYGYSD